jgi:hypothetical protein
MVLGSQHDLAGKDPGKIEILLPPADLGAPPPIFAPQQ